MSALHSPLLPTAPRPRRRCRGAILLTVAGLVTAAATGCTGDPPPGGGEAVPAAPPAAASAAPSAVGTPLVLLISLDTLRADAVGAIGGRQPSLTPALDAFAADSVVFTGATAPMAFTLPSHMSMLTGLHPVVHGVSTEKDRLGPGIETLAGWLAAAGFRTVGRVTNDWLKGDFGFARGFDSYVRIRHDLTYADRVNAAALETLDQAGDDRPLFLFLHYMDPHSDFTSRRNLLPYYAPPEYLGDLVEGPGDRRFCDAEERCATAWLQQADREARAVPETELAVVRGLYEAGLGALDAELGRLFDELRRRGIYDPALIVVTSDHGEEFREHGRFLHSQTYAESLHVPLLVKLPGGQRAGSRSDGLADLLDLSPTLLELLGLPLPEKLQGISLVPALAGGDADRRQSVGEDKLVRSLYSLTTERYKLLHDLEGGDDELYDLSRDPGELRNLVAEHPKLAQELRRRLRQTLRQYRRLAKQLATPDATAGADTLLTDEERERLKSLGYL